MKPSATISYKSEPSKLLPYRYCRRAPNIQPAEHAEFYINNGLSASMVKNTHYRTKHTHRLQRPARAIALPLEVNRHVVSQADDIICQQYARATSHRIRPTQPHKIKELSSLGLTNLENALINIAVSISWANKGLWPRKRLITTAKIAALKNILQSTDWKY